MFVQTEVTPNPNSLKFLPGKKVSNSGLYEITKKNNKLYYIDELIPMKPIKKENFPVKICLCCYKCFAQQPGLFKITWYLYFYIHTFTMVNVTLNDCYFLQCCDHFFGER